MNLSDLLNRLNDENITLSGNPQHVITRISSPDKADTHSLCVIWDKDALNSLAPDVPIVAPSDFFSDNRDGLITSSPRALLPKLLALFTNTSRRSGIHPSAVVEPGAKIAESSYIGACVYVGERCVVGEGTVIEPNVTLLADVKIGKNCLIHSGSVIGADGFGFERTADGLIKIPQTGGVTIGDDVEIGACTTIDRGTMNDTLINSGTKIDNHVQIGHNAQIGRNCIICSMTGIAGSSVLEDNVTISVQAGVTDHVRIGANTIIAGRTGVTNDIPANSIVSGFPARPHNEAKRALVLAADLPTLYKRVRMLEKKLGDLQKS